MSQPRNGKRKRGSDAVTSKDSQAPVTLQIVAGSYESVLHGIIARISQESGDATTFEDSFLINAHTSAIRCLAISPPSASAPSKTPKRILASGSTDERIQLYKLSTTARNSAKTVKELLPTSAISQEPTTSQNRELGSLLHHSSAITTLHFPSRSNLISTSMDNSIAITRSRDWTVLKTMKAPIPRAVGRPSGDTAGPGEFPAGIMDTAIHPTAKVMLTVGKGERCMRSWDLVRGKKAEALNFDKSLLAAVGESRHPGSGEGRQICWSIDGEEFAVGFERGIAIFGLDSRVKGIIRPSPPTKLHKMQCIRVSEHENTQALAIATEDGRILFYNSTPSESAAASTLPSPSGIPATDPSVTAGLPLCTIIAQLGGISITNSRSRIKDFVVLSHPKLEAVAYLVTASSDGAIRVWLLNRGELAGQKSAKSTKQPKADSKSTTASNGATLRQVGSLLGTYETGNRVTCLVAFVLDSWTSETDDVASLNGQLSSEDRRKDS